MPDPESDLFGDVYYEPSDSVAIFEESGVVRMEPILLQRSTIPNHTEPAYFVLTSSSSTDYSLSLHQSSSPSHAPDERSYRQAA